MLCCCTRNSLLRAVSLFLSCPVLSCPVLSGVSQFVAEFVKRKLAERNRKPGGKKKKGAAAAATAAAAVPAAPQTSGVSAAAVGMVHAGEGGGCMGGGVDWIGRGKEVGGEDG